MSHPDRRDRLRTVLRAAGLDALLVTDLLDVRYLTGFTGSNAAAVIGADPAGDLLCTDGRYRLQAAGQSPDLDVVIDRPSGPAAAARVPAGSTLGYDSAGLTVDGLAAVRDATPGRRLLRAPGLVGGLRAVKDAAEVDAVRRACELADTALRGLLDAGGLIPGRTEREVALDLEDRMRRLGAAGPSFETILAAGPNSAVPHHRPTGAELRRGDLVKIDFGATLDGYHSDTTRTFCLGPAAGWQRELHALVDAAASAGRAALLDGAVVTDVDAAARDVVADAGHADEFPHGLGHGVGLAVHEAPWLTRTGLGTVAAGQLVTVEPGVYLEGRGGVRIEDLLHVVAGGPPVPLTTLPRELVEV
ncbi:MULTISPECIES: M24 family metallopeptidase [Pseudonocardia]|uniref:Xaa-Pro dipeptidase n=2 Tax=Pseudonocardia TaxID=1847 RepID=A0A1Y2MVE7_PSEAH|nr:MULTISPECIES: Xaa-Pro peptidase family protein [Pseudonocardia]OSY39155.1 Xaa-Pro dipeptidase [Pseudonocardia autotrophica]TDN71250.1 Xaa-Pro aminopeptidase [Pseudonocardia autotrophica]BBG01922.1 X-Pro dipeptidase [Pseudonocardia autotrophica]GEC23086.1 X-Pro dipeptidase [Pseudonocardia saturnea]